MFSLMVSGASCGWKEFKLNHLELYKISPVHLFWKRVKRKTQHIFTAIFHFFKQSCLQDACWWGRVSMCEYDDALCLPEQSSFTFVTQSESDPITVIKNNSKFTEIFSPLAAGLVCFCRSNWAPLKIVRQNVLNSFCHLDIFQSI